MYTCIAKGNVKKKIRFSSCQKYLSPMSPNEINPQCKNVILKNDFPSWFNLTIILSCQIKIIIHDVKEASCRTSRKSFKLQIIAMVSDIGVEHDCTFNHCPRPIAYTVSCSQSSSITWKIWLIIFYVWRKFNFFFWRNSIENLVP